MCIKDLKGNSPNGINLSWAVLDNSVFIHCSFLYFLNSPFIAYNFYENTLI